MPPLPPPPLHCCHARREGHMTSGDTVAVSTIALTTWRGETSFIHHSSSYPSIHPLIHSSNYFCLSKTVPKCSYLPTLTFSPCVLHVIMQDREGLGILRLQARAPVVSVYTLQSQRPLRTQPTSVHSAPMLLPAWQGWSSSERPSSYGLHRQLRTPSDSR